MKRTYELINLDCAHCASKIETAIKKIDGVDSASINFVAKKLTLEADDNMFDEVFAKAVAVFADIEPDCKIKTEEGMEPEHKSDLIRIVISAVLFVADLLIPVEGIAKLLIFLLPYFMIGYDVLLRAVKNIIRGQIFDENFLMALATIGALAIGDYPEAVVVMLFYQTGELFQRYAVGSSRRSIQSLMEIKPDFARVIRDGKEITTSPENVRPGETIVIRPGERIPLDGQIIEGNTTVNTAALTGESVPRDCLVGESVYSGSVNITCVIRVQVTSGYAESTVVKILDLVENSGSRKAKVENFITRFARYYTPIVVIGAVLLAVIPPLLIDGQWAQWVNRALTFLVISCPCALVISVPLTFFGGIGGASKNGILIKGSNYLEALSKVNIVAFDKTGTLTHGSFNVTAVHPRTISEAQLLDIAALSESSSNHPIAESIIRSHGGHIDTSRIGFIEEIAGQGIKAIIDGKTVLAGNGKLLSDAGVQWHGCSTHVGTTIHIAIDGVYCGHIVISDEVKADSGEAISRLKKMGIAKTVMLTGDADKVGKAVGEQLGFDEVYTELLPTGKAEIVERLLDEKPSDSTFAFVGDGINDAPVLALADVGIAMGALGSDAAIEAADIVLMEDKPSRLPLAISIAKKTIAIAKQNIVFALGIKLIVLALGALGIADMWMAVFADVGVSVLAILNAMRALRQGE